MVAGQKKAVQDGRNIVGKKIAPDAQNTGEKAAQGGQNFADILKRCDELVRREFPVSYDKELAKALNLCVTQALTDGTTVRIRLRKIAEQISV